MTKMPTNKGALDSQSKLSIGISLCMVLIVALLMLMPGTAMANGGGGPSTGQVYTPPDTDYFASFLVKGMLGDAINFGADNAVGTFSGNGTLGKVFKEFNLGVSFFASLIIMFIAIVGILNSGQDGEFLGKRWSSFWVPFRFAAGAALLLPITNAGYSFVQAMCIWIAGQGIGFAHNVWGAILDNHAPPSGVQVTQTSNANEFMRQMFLNEICASYMNDKTDAKVEFKNVQQGRAEAMPNYMERWRAEWASTSGSFKSGTMICGYMEYNYSVANNDAYKEIRQSIAKSYGDQIISSRGVIQPIAQSYVQELMKEKPDLSKVVEIEAKIQYQINVQALAMKSKIEAAVDASIEKHSSNGPGLTETLKKLGFAVAGAYYMELSKTANAVREGMSAQPTISGPDYEYIAGTVASTQTLSVIKNRFDSASIDAANAGAASAAPSSYNGNVKTIELNKEMFSGLKDGIWDNFWQQISMTILNTVIGVGANHNTGDYGLLSGMLNGNNNNFTVTSANHVNHSVIAQLKDKGDTILNIAGWTLTSYVLVSAAANWAEKSTVGAVVNWATNGALKTAGAILEKIGTFILLMVLSLASLGVMLAVIVPMTPFMIWTMGIAGMLILIVESLIASMIWAVMLMHPSGEGVTSDQARQGLMILLMLFFRPTLMLMGMAAGIFMVEPMVAMVNDLFYFMFKSTQRGTTTGLFITFGVISIYATMVLTIVRKSFALIHLVPDRVLRWVGGPQHEQLGESEIADRGEAMAGTASQRVTQMSTSMSNKMQKIQRRNPGG